MLVNKINVAPTIQYGFEPNTQFIYKDKVPHCLTYSGNPFIRQNKLICKTQTI